MLHRGTSALANPAKLSLKVIVILLRDPITLRAAFTRYRNVSWCAPSKQSMSCSSAAKAGRNPRSTAGMYSPSAHPHSSQGGPKSKCTGGHASLKGQGPALLSSTNALFIPVMGLRPERHILNFIFILRPNNLT